MNRFRYFTAWLIESTLQSAFSEAMTRFSQKYPNMDVNDVPPGFWQWVEKKMKEDSKFHPRIEDDDGTFMSREKVVQLISARAQGRPYRAGGGGPVAPAAARPRPEQPRRPEPVTSKQIDQPPTPAGDKPKEWVLAKVLDVPGWKKGEYVVATRNGGNWTVMNRNAQTKEIETAKLSASIESVKKPEDNKPLTALDPEDLWKKVGLPPVVKKPTPAPVKAICDNTDKNPHILSEEKLKDGSGEGWDIDQKFARMLESPKQNHMMINALAGSGKAQPLNSLLMTPEGWVKMGEIKIGDKVFGSDGLPHKVKGVFPQGEKEVCEVVFSDGVKVKCCVDHLWTTETKLNRDKCRAKKLPLFSLCETVTTKQMIGNLTHRSGLNHYIPLVKPLQFDSRDTVIDPYVMGILLGDGSFRTGSVSYTTTESEIVEAVDGTLPHSLMSNHVSRYDYRIAGHIKGRRNEIVKEIKRLKLWNKKSENKFVPDLYKFNDFETRVATLQGLLDTDGSVRGSNVEYYTVSKQLAEDVKYLVQSLGGTASISTKETSYVYKGEKLNGKLCYRLNVKLPGEIEPFRLSRKKAEYTPRTKYLPKRAIKSIEVIGREECQCISIDSPDNLYVTDNCVLTHNTTMLKHLAWKYGRSGQKWLYLVFNTKNKAEAEEYDKGCRKFPEFVQVATTNSFLGDALKNAKNKGRVPQTKRIADLAKLGLQGKIEKARFITDGETFQRKMKQEWGIPFRNDVDENLLREFGIRQNSMKYYMGALTGGKNGVGIIGQIRKQFQERVLTLLDRLKAYSVDPRKVDSLEGEVKKVFDRYDAHEDEVTKIVKRGYFDTDLEDVKERIDDYEADFKAVIITVLNDLMGYDFMSKNYREEVIAAATWLLKETLPLASKDTVSTGYGRGAINHKLGDFRDFSDDLWFSSIHAEDMHWDKYDVVLADEVQDFNENQKIMLKKLHDSGAKIVAVGDPNQGIYRFRGADGDAFKNLSGMLGDLSMDKEDWKENTLTRNFRSRKCILDFVNERTHVKNLLQGKKFDDGDDKCRVTDQDYKYDDVFKMIKEERTNDEIKGTAFISRTNEPLVHASLKLLGNAVPFVIVGRDVAGDLIKHIEYLIKESEKEAKWGRGRGLGEDSPVSDLQQRVIAHAEKEEEQYGDKATKRHYLQELKDTSLAITSTIDQFAGPQGGEQANTDYGPYRGGNEPEQPTKSVSEYMMWVKKNLSGLDVQEDEDDYREFKKRVEEENPVILTTAHKSKGLEFSRVFILRDDQFPHPKSKHPGDLAQEDNAQYVAYTRAMDELHLIKLKGQPGYKDS